MAEQTPRDSGVNADSKVLVERYVLESVLKTGILLTSDSDALRRALLGTLDKPYVESAARLLNDLVGPLAQAMQREGL